MLRGVVVAITLGGVLSACAGSQTPRPATATDLWRWVPAGANSLFWVDLDGLRRSSLDDLLDNDVDSLKALQHEFGGNLPASGPSDRLMSQGLRVWRKLDAVLVAAKLQPAAPVSTTPPAAAAPASERADESVLVFVARWTAADIDALATITQTPAAAPSPAAQPAAPQPAAPQPDAPQTPAGGAPPDSGGLSSGAGLGGTGALTAASPPASEPLKRSRVAGRPGWSWGTSVLVPVGAGVWLMGPRPAVEQLLQTTPAGPGRRAHPELARNAQDVGFFEQTVAFVGRHDSVAEAQSLLPDTGVSGRAPWPEVISTGDWFAFGLQLDDEANLRLLIEPTDPSRVQAIETRLSAWRERLVQSGLAGLVYLREALADARVSSRNDRVELTAVIGRDRVRLAYSRVSGLAVVAAAVAVAFIAVLGSVLGSAGSALGEGLESPAP